MNIGVRAGDRMAVEFLKNMKQSAEGRDFLRYLRRYCFARENAYDPRIPVKQVIFRCGMQEVFRHLEELIETEFDWNLLEKNEREILHQQGKEWEDE